MKKYLARAYAILKSYWVKVYWEEISEGGLQLRKLTSDLKFLGWLGVIIVLLNLLLTTYLYFYSGGLPSLHIIDEVNGTTFSVPSTSFYFALLGYALGWAFLLAGALYSNAWAFLVAGVAFVYYVGPLGFALTNKWLFALPALLVIILATLRTHKWRRSVPLFLLCFGFAFIILYTTPVKTMIPRDYRWVGILPLGLIVYYLITSPWLARERKHQPLFVFSVSAGVILLFFLLCLSLSADQEAARSGVFLSFKEIMYLVSVFWFILGVELVEMSLRVTDWAVDLGRMLFSERIVRTSIAVVWMLELALTPFVLRAADMKVSFLSFTLSPDLLVSLEIHFYLLLGILALVFILVWKRKLNTERLLYIFSFYLLSFLLIQGYYSNLLSFAEVEELGLWTLFIYLAGMTWQTFLGGAGFVEGDGKWFPHISRLLLFLGVILLMTAVSHLKLVAGDPQFIQLTQLEPFLGIIYLGLPYALYLFLYRQGYYTPVPQRQLLTLFVLGAVVAIPALMVEHSPFLTGISVIGALILAIVVSESLKFLAVYLTVYKTPGFTEVMDGLACVGAAGLGFATFYNHPLLIPFLPGSWQSVYFLAPVRENYEVFLIFFTHLASAAVLGYFVGLARQRVIRGLSSESTTLRVVRQLVVLGSGLFLAILFRGLYEAVLRSQKDVLLSTHLIWLYISIPLLVVLIFLYFSLGLHRKQWILSPRALVAVMAVAVLIGSAVGGVLWYKGRALTYQDKEYGFSMNHPASWRQETPPEGALLEMKRAFEYGDALVFVFVTPLPEGVTLTDYATFTEQQWKESGVGYQKESEEEVIINGISMIKRIFTWEANPAEGEKEVFKALHLYFLREQMGFTWAGMADLYTYDLAIADFNRMAESLRFRD